MSARLEKFKFSKNQEFVVNEELVIPVPDGYQSYSEADEGTGTRLLVITPENYPRTADPFEAEFAMVIPQYAAVGVPFDPEKAEPYKFIFTSNYPVFTDGVIIHEVACRENFGILHQNFYNIDDLSWNKVLAMIFVNSGAYFVHVYFNHPGYDAQDPDLIEHFVSTVDEWMSMFKLTTESDVSSAIIPSASPDESLYPRYKTGSLQNNGGTPGFTIIQNASGTDYQFISFANALSDEDVSDEYRAAYQRIVSADIKGFSLADEADKMKSLFRVSTSAFQMGHDRECEIDEGYIHKDYMLVALRSFAWTLAAYCDKNNKTPESVTLDELNDIIKHCEKKDWLNFNADSYCKGLCDNGELHIYYIPDAAATGDRKLLQPSQEDYDRVESMRRAFPAYNEILDQVRSLDSLRSDLEYVYPAMATFYNMLNADRNRDEELTGSVADNLYAWCAITKAAKEPFYVEDGPMRCFFTQLTSPISSSPLSPMPITKGFSDAVRSVKNDSVSYKRSDSIDVIQLTEKSKGVGIINGEFWEYTGGELHIALPEKTTKIGAFTFQNSEVETVVIPEGVTIIDNYAFSGSSVSCVIFPKSLEVIGMSSFEECSELKEIILPDGLSEIGIGAFDNCKSLKYMYIPNSVHVSHRCFNNLEQCVFHVDPGSDAEKFIREEYEDYQIVYSKPAGYGKQPKLNVIPYTPPTDEDGYFLLTPDDPDVESDFGELTKYNGHDTSIRISDEFSSIADEAFFGCDDLERIIIPESIEEIGDSVFTWCNNLKEAVFLCETDTIPSLFGQCHALEKIILPDNYTVIKEYAFSDSKSLSSFAFSNGLGIIEEGAFSGCDRLESVTLPDTVTELGKGAFGSCKSIRKVILSESLEKIGEDAFSGCESLETIVIPKSVKSIGDYAFRDCINLKTVIFNGDIETVGEDIFANCDKLDRSSLPAAFKLPSVSDDVMSQDNPNLVIEDGVLVKVKKIAEGTVIVPGTVKKIAKNAFRECGKVREIIISEGVVETEDGAFSNTKSLQTVSLPSTLEALGTMSLIDGITEITIPGNIRELPDSAFWWCGNLKKVNLSSGLVRIGKDAFKNTAVESIAIPDTVTYIGDSAFSVLSETSHLKEVVMSACIIEIGDSAFKNTLITEIELPDSLKRIGKYVFSSCKQLKTVKLSNNLTEIPDSAFSDCEELCSIVLGNKINTIGKYAFSGCKKLSTITIPKGVTKIGDQAFSECVSLKRVVIPDSVTKLGAWAFNDCDSLEDIYIPSSVKTFAEFALSFGSHEPKVHIVKGSRAEEACEDEYVTNIVYETEESMKAHQSKNK